MKRRLQYLVVSAVSVLTAGGCGSYKDLTQTLAAQRSGVLGRWYQVSAESDLIRDKPSDTLDIVPTDYPHWPRNERVGKVQPGTRVVSSRVVEIREAALISDLTQRTLGMILDGPYAGKEVDLTESLAADQKGILVPTTGPSHPKLPWHRTVESQ